MKKLLLREEIQEIMGEKLLAEFPLPCHGADGFPFEERDEKVSVTVRREELSCI